MQIQNIGVWYEGPARIALQAVPIGSPPHRGKYAFNPCYGYYLHPSDAEDGLVVRYRDEDGDVVEVKIKGEHTHFELLSAFQSLPEEDRLARIPRTAEGQVYELRRIFRK